MKNLAIPLAPIGGSAPTSHVVTIAAPIEGSMPALGAVHVSVIAVPAVDPTTQLTIHVGTTVVGTGTVGAGANTVALGSGAHALTASIVVDGRTWTSPVRHIVCSVPVITLQSLGPEFRPRVHLHAGASATVLWRWSDGTSSNLLAPIFVGSAGIHTLQCDPPSAIEALNFGYDGGDGGDTYTPVSVYGHPTTSVSAISGLQAGSPNLRRFLANGTAGLDVDLSGLPIEAAEFFRARTVSADYSGCGALQRVCHELTAIRLLDLSDVTAIQDIRGRNQAIGTTPFVIRLSDVSQMWHFCVGDQAGSVDGVDGLFDGTIAMPAMDQFWTWGSRVGGILSPRGRMRSLEAADSLHTGFSSANLTWAGVNRICNVSGNPLTTLDLTGMGDTTYQVNLTNCNLTQTLVDYALAFLAAGTGSNGTLSLTGCAVPSAAGLANRSVLLGRGWTVSVAT